MGYANPMQKITYSWGLLNIGAGTLTYTIRGPKGMAGRLRDIVVSGDTLFTNTTTSARVQVGTAGTATKFGDLDLGVLAAGANIVASKDQATALKGVELPADTDAQVKFVAPTGGSPAGKGYPNLVIEWY